MTSKIVSEYLLAVGNKGFFNTFGPSTQGACHAHAEYFDIEKKLWTSVDDVPTVQDFNSSFLVKTCAQTGAQDD